MLLLLSFLQVSNEALAALNRGGLFARWVEHWLIDLFCICLPLSFTIMEVATGHVVLGMGARY
jgi:hypothetical protein